MDEYGEVGFSPESSQDSPSLQEKLRETLGVSDAQQLEVVEGDRFAIGFIDRKEGERHFFKYAEGVNAFKLLQEWQGTGVALRLGLPVVRVHGEPREGKHGTSVEFEQVTDAKLILHEMIGGVDSEVAHEYGSRIGRTLFACGAPEISPGLDTSRLNPGDYRNKDPDHVYQVFEGALAKVWDPSFEAERRKFIGDQELNASVAELKTCMGKLGIIKGQDMPDVDGRIYLVHNDMAVNNLAFPDNPTDGREVIILDWEHAGTTTSRRLSMMTDMMNLYGRMWPSPSMQKGFIEGFLDAAHAKYPDDPEKFQEAHTLLRASVGFGSLYLAQFGMDPGHEEHIMSKALLSNLPEGLKKVDEYNSAISTLSQEAA